MDNYSLYWNYLREYGPTGKEGFLGVCGDLGIDPKIMDIIVAVLGIDDANTWFHGFSFALWLMREKRGL